MNIKLKLLVMCLLITAMAEAKSLNIDEAVDYYLNNSNSSKNVNLDKNIREEGRKELLNQINRDLTVNAKTAYSTKKNEVTVNSKITYKDAYLSVTPTTSTTKETEYSVIVGVEKTLNEYLYNTNKGKIVKNDLENKTETLKSKTEIKSALVTIENQYLVILNLENSIKSKNSLLEEKNKDLEIAKIKKNNNNISNYDLSVIELNVETLKTEIELAMTEKEQAIKEFKNLIGTDDEIEITDVEAVSEYKIYKDESSIKEIENSIALAKDELKGIKVSNMPELTASLGYDIKNEDTSVGLNFLWIPLDYKGDEIVKKLNIQKLENQMTDAKKTSELDIVKEENEIKKQELNLNISKKTLELGKVEFEKYKTMKAMGNLSEFDYYVKQKELMDKEIDYLNKLNSLNLAKKIQNIYFTLK